MSTILKKGNLKHVNQLVDKMLINNNCQVDL